ncbi:hypothetical protein FRC12_001486 [Ceratobasidium sp. 428]|nr:hypothetical protein FRC12_001486 [Ceratobasidium sp. 428]
MPSNINPVVAFREMLGLALMSTGMQSPMHHVLSAVIISTMALLAASGEQARLRPTTIPQDVLAVSNEVIILSICFGLNVQFRFNDIFEVPLNIIADGHIIGFDSFHVYLKSKPVSPEELRRAQLMFNFLALVRHFANLLGPQGVSELVEEFKNPSKASKSTDCPKVIRTRSRRYGLSTPPALPTTHTTRTAPATPSLPPKRQPLTTRDINRNISVDNSSEQKNKDSGTTKRTNRLKRLARIWTKENAPPVAETERRERNKRKIRAGFI